MTKALTTEGAAVSVIADDAEKSLIAWRKAWTQIARGADERAIRAAILAARPLPIPSDVVPAILGWFLNQLDQPKRRRGRPRGARRLLNDVIRDQAIAERVEHWRAWLARPAGRNEVAKKLADDAKQSAKGPGPPVRGPVPKSLLLLNRDRPYDIAVRIVAYERALTPDAVRRAKTRAQKTGE